MFFGAAMISLLVGGGHANAQSASHGDYDVDDDRLLEISSLEQGDASHGAVFLDGTTINYRHDGSETTTDSFFYIVSDGTDTAAGAVEVAVTPVNDPPVAVADTAEVDEGGTLSVEASVLLNNDNDSEGDTLSVTSVGDAVNGNVSLAGTTIIYEHDGFETTAGRFSYVVSDGTDSATARVEVTVAPVDDEAAIARVEVTVAPVDDEAATARAEVTVAPVDDEAAIADESTAGVGPTQEAVSTAKPTPESVAAPTDAPVPPENGGAMNLTLILLIILAVDAAIVGGVAVVMKRRKRA